MYSRLRGYRRILQIPRIRIYAIGSDDRDTIGTCVCHVLRKLRPGALLSSIHLVQINTNNEGKCLVSSHPLQRIKTIGGISVRARARFAPTPRMTRRGGNVNERRIVQSSSNEGEYSGIRGRDGREGGQKCTTPNR